MVIDNKKYTLGDLISCIGDLIKQYEEDLKKEQINVTTQHKLLKTKDVVKQYPVMSLYSLDKAVKDGKLTYTKIGNKNYFNSMDIEKFITSNKKGDD